MSVDIKEGEVPLFNGIDFLDWKRRMANYLVSKDLDIVVGLDMSTLSLSVRQPILNIEGNADLTTRKDLKARAQIENRLSKGVQQFIETSKAKTSHELWARLVAAYQRTSGSATVNAVKNLSNHRLGDKTVQDYIAELNSIVNNITVASGHVFPDTIIAAFILAGLPEDYSPVLTAIDSHSSQLGSDHVRKMLLNKEVELSSSSTNNDEKCHISKMQAELTAMRTELTKFRKICTHCHKNGHLEKDCFVKHPEKRPKWMKALNENKEPGNAALYTGGTVPQSDYSPKTSSQVSLIDSGASTMMEPRRELFIDMKANPSNNIIQQAGKGSSLSIDGTGTTHIILGNQQYKLKKTLWVKGLRTALFSVGEATSLGLSFIFSGQECRIYGQNMELLVVVPKVNNLYPILWDYASPTANVCAAPTISDKQLLHECLGHPSKEAPPDSDSGPCTGCVLGKISKAPFKGQWKPEKEPPDSFHTDLMIFPVPSLGGSRFVQVFIQTTDRDNRAQRFPTVFFLKSKSEALQNLKTLNSRHKNQTGHSIGHIHSDNEVVLVSKEITTYCQQEGITQSTSAPYTPQQNPFAERFNRTILESAECMRLSAGAPQQFWAEAVDSAAYIHERRHHSSLKMSPFECKFNSKPSLDSLRRWGCRAWIPQQQGPKLRPKRIPGIMVGYSRRSKGSYRIYDPAKNQIVIVRGNEVVFDQNCLPFRDLAEQGREQLGREQKGRIIIGDIEPAAPSNIDQDGIQGSEQGSEARSQPASQDSNTEPRTEPRRSSRARVPPDRYDPGKDNSVQIESISICNLECDIERTNRANAVTHADLAKDNIIWNEIFHRTLIANSEGQWCFNTDLVDLEIPTDVLASDVPIPNSWSEAVRNDKWGVFWKSAAQKEYAQLLKNETWRLCPKPANRKAIACKWVFQVKSNDDGSIKKFKCRLVIKGFSQRPGVDYTETFAPVAHSSTQRILLAFVANNQGYRIRQADIIGAFLKGDIDAEIYMSQPPGFEESELGDHVCRLMKGLYGLKQAGHIFNKKLDKYLVNDLKLRRSEADPCLYFKTSKSGRIVLLSLHVDDQTFAYHENDREEADRIVKSLDKEFGIEDLGENPNQILGVRIRHDVNSGRIRLDQETFIQEILKRFKLENCNTVDTPHQPGVHLSKMMSPVSAEDRLEMESVPYAQLVGALRYIADKTRPEIAYQVGVLGRFVSNPGKQHWHAAQRVLRYLKGTATYGLEYTRNPNQDSIIAAWQDADFAGEPGFHRSTSAFLFKMANAAISWSSKLQKNDVALSSLESDYISQCRAAQEATSLKRLVSEIYPNKTIGPIEINGDNQGSQTVAKNWRTDVRTKHIAVKYHYTRFKIDDGTITLKYCPTKQMIADSLTKPIDRKKFEWCRESMGVKSLEPLNLGEAC
jgi:hypothetical protein